MSGPGQLFSFPVSRACYVSFVFCLQAFSWSPATFVAVPLQATRWQSFKHSHPLDSEAGSVAGAGSLGTLGTFGTFGTFVRSFLRGMCFAGGTELANGSP